MKIAQIAPIIESVPPKKYGGTERVIHALTEELVRMGHDVTLFASGDSTTTAKLVSVVPKAMRNMKGVDPYSANSQTALNYGLAYKLQDQFDIIHDHHNHLTMPTAELSRTPAILTMHGPFLDEVHDLYQTLTNPFIVTISKKQAKMAPKNINHLKTIYHGLAMDDYPFSDRPGKYLLFVGRITREKGVHHAIEVAKRLNLPLIIAAKLELNFKPDVDYYRKFVKPYLGDQIKWVGEVTEEERNELMSKALVFLHPVTWPEPFGLTLIESMGCGTPVVAMNQGSIPEIIENGKTGFVVETVDEMVEAVSKIKQIDRKYCRDYALLQFGVQRMAKEYIETYKLAIEKNKQRQQKRNLGNPLVFSERANLLTKTYANMYTQNIRSSLKSVPRAHLPIEEEK